jgi:hypothetical protein
MNNAGKNKNGWSKSIIDPQGQGFKALVFEFMSNGSLEGWLHPKSEEVTLGNTLSLRG